VEADEDAITETEDVWQSKCPAAPEASMGAWPLPAEADVHTSDSMIAAPSRKFGITLN